MHRHSSGFVHNVFIFILTLLNFRQRIFNADNFDKQIGYKPTIKVHRSWRSVLLSSHDEVDDEGSLCFAAHTKVISNKLFDLLLPTVVELWASDLIYANFALVNLNSGIDESTPAVSNSDPSVICLGRWFSIETFVLDLL